MAIAGSNACRIASQGDTANDFAPVAGSQFSLSEISATRIMASQNPGIATPSEATMLTILSTQPLGLIAATIPIGIPVASASMSAMATISSVFGKAREIESTTFSPESSDCERSPWTAFPSHAPYCTMNGRSRPYIRLISAMRMSEALSPASVTAMSPGTSLSSENTMNVASRITGSACNSRLPMTFAGLRRAMPLALQPDVVVFRLAEQVRSVALHALVHRDQLVLEGERHDEGILHHEPLHDSESLAANLDVFRGTRFLDRGFQFRRDRSPAAVVIGILGEHQGVRQAWIRSPGPGGKQPGAAFFGAEKRRRGFRNRCVDKAYADAGLAELFDQDFLALNRILIRVAAEFDHRSFLEARFDEQLARPVGIVRVEVRNRSVVGPMRFRQVHISRLGKPCECGFDEGFPVDRKVERLANPDVVERRFCPVQENLEDVERRPIDHLEVVRAFHDCFLARRQLINQIVLSRGDRAHAGCQFGDDRKLDPFGIRTAFLPVFFVALDDDTFAVRPADKGIGPGAHRRTSDVADSACLENRW